MESYKMQHQLFIVSGKIGLGTKYFIMYKDESFVDPIEMDSGYILDRIRDKFMLMYKNISDRNYFQVVALRQDGYLHHITFTGKVDILKKYIEAKD